MIQEPMLCGQPLTLIFLYFIWYSFLGWIMETTYCSVCRGAFVNRGFLAGPFCPIYGVGALLMVFFLRPFAGNPPLFYVMSVVVMSAWEYLVGWLLETTTHMKYWDYSNERCNLKGRICLRNSLIWGVVAYVAICWIHPFTESLFARFSPLARWIASGVLLVITLTDAVETIRRLALGARLLEQADMARQELENRRREMQTRLDEATVQAALLKLELRERDVQADAEHYLRRFHDRYEHLRSLDHEDVLNVLQVRSEQLRAYRKERIAARKRNRQKKS